jgi:hypothetical protein
MENISYIYGETLHRYLYPAIQQVEIEIEGGKIYNWKTNTWETCLYEQVITSEMEKVYHVKKRQSDTITAKIYGLTQANREPDEMDNKEVRLLSKVIEIPKLITIATGEIFDSDLTKYLFRQKTQELLYLVKSKDKINIQERREIQKKIKTLFGVMRKYMKDNDLLDDAFMKMLCDDLYVIYNTLGSSNGQMFALSRFTTQGRQQTYSATIPNINDMNEETKSDISIDTMDLHNFVEPPYLKKNNYYQDDDTVVEHYIEEDKYLKIENYLLSQEQNTCYATQTTIDIFDDINHSSQYHNYLLDDENY